MRKAILLLILCTLVLVTPVQTNAVTDHGLTWGVEVGQFINYTLTASSLEGGKTTEPISYLVIYRPVIPLDVTERSDIQFAGVIVYDENGTIIPYLGLNLMYDFPTGLPIGNWGLINSIFSDYFEGEGVGVSLICGISKSEYHLRTP